MAKRLRRVTPPKPGERSGVALRPSHPAMLWYQRQLRELVERMARDVGAEVVALFESPVAEESKALDATLGTTARVTMNALSRRFNKLFREQAAELADRMVRRVDRDAKGKTLQSLRELSGDLTLPARALRTGGLDDVVKAAIAENVALIKSISEQYLSDVSGTVYRAITSGNGLADIVPDLRKREGITLRRARLIANDQVRKTTAAVGRARNTANGLTRYRWVHSGGGREPRPLHLELDGQIFEYDDPPIADERTGERAHPGVLINCRCVAVPIAIDFDAL